VSEHEPGLIVPKMGFIDLPLGTIYYDLQGPDTGDPVCRFLDEVRRILRLLGRVFARFLTISRRLGSPCKIYRG